ncbi:MAG: hypothetical protein KDC10_15965, partial [Calditrichaeota bacterium]|nr:hypothetical protein [Calditrichota bacterium]
MQPWILLLFIMTSLCRAAILHVPADYPAIQPAMDASAPGDTVQVARGTWFGLYTSPTHSLTLCSDFLFSQDSMDINETILDGEYAGTILDLVCEYEWFALCGFTIQHGMGQQLGNSAYCDRAGAVQLNRYVNADIQGIVFRENHAPRSVPILYQGQVCSISQRTGSVILKDISCFNNTVDAPTLNTTRAILISTRESKVIIDGMYYDGGGGDVYPLYVFASSMDSVYVNNVSIVNSTASYINILVSMTRASGSVFSNLQSTDIAGPNSCAILLQTGVQGVSTSNTIVRNVQVTGTHGTRAFRFSSQTNSLDMDGLFVSNCRSTATSAGGAFVHIASDVGGTLRNVHFHHNTSGDSVSQVANSLLYTNGLDIDGASFHDNRSIVPADPNASNTGGNYLIGGMLAAVGPDPVLQNLEFVNNRVDDLDDYSNHTPSVAYYNNPGREMTGEGGNSLTVRNVQVHNSRQPNHCPEVTEASGLEAARPGITLAFGARNKLVVENVLVEDSDDGGLAVGADSLWVSDVVLRNVGRVGLLMGRNESPLSPPLYSFRNIDIENVDAVDNYLPQDELRLSNQSALFIDVRSDFENMDPTVLLENVTITGCDGMQGLFNFYEPVDIHFSNCIIWNNNYENLIT